jgi:hypothetical protein
MQDLFSMGGLVNTNRAITLSLRDLLSLFSPSG